MKATNTRDSKDSKESRDQKTPPPEVQMEDAGTPASGNSGLGGRASAEEGQIKPSGAGSESREQEPEKPKHDSGA